MHHQISGKKLNRSSNERKRLFRNLVRSLVLHGKITTTLAKAKAVQPLIEKLITRARENTLTNRRLLLKKLSDKKVVDKLLTDIGPLFKETKGGYTRITKLNYHLGDNSTQVLFSFTENVANSEITKEGKKEKSPEKKISGKENHAKDQNNKGSRN